MTINLLTGRNISKGQGWTAQNPCKFRSTGTCGLNGGRVGLRGRNIQYFGHESKKCWFDLLFPKCWSWCSIDIFPIAVIVPKAVLTWELMGNEFLPPSKDVFQRFIRKGICFLLDPVWNAISSFCNAACNCGNCIAVSTYRDSISYSILKVHTFKKCSTFAFRKWFRSCSSSTS